MKKLFLILLILISVPALATTTTTWQVTTNWENSNTVNNFNDRMIISAANITTSGSYVRVKFKGHTTLATTLDGASICERNGTSDDCTGTPTRLTFSGSNSGTIPANSFLWSDWVLFTLTESKDYFVSLYGATLNNIKSPSGNGMYYTIGGDGSQVASWDASYLEAWTFFVAAVEVSDTDPTPPEPPAVGSGNQVPWRLATTPPPHNYAGCLLGDSLTANYNGYNIDYYLTPLTGDTITNLAVSGDNIAAQQTAWTNDANKATYDWIIILIGINDLKWDTGHEASEYIGRLQTLVNTINSGKKAGAKVIVSQLLPAREWLGDTQYAIWLDVNTGIPSLANVDAIVTTTTTELDDGNGYIKESYEAINDGVHENNAAREYIANAYKTTLQNLGLY